MGNSETSQRFGQKILLTPPKKKKKEKEKSGGFEYAGGQ